MVTSAELINDILSEELAGRPNDIGNFPRRLGNYICDRKYSKAQAVQVANKCNAFLLKEAQQKGRPLGDQAAMIEPDDHGFFRVWFPLRRMFRTPAEA